MASCTTCRRTACRPMRTAITAWRSKAGNLTAANCASCHGVHNIFRSSDPRSTVNAPTWAKRAASATKGRRKPLCRSGPCTCRRNAGPNHPVVKWIRWTYWVLIPFTLGFMLLHNLLDLLAKLIRRRPRQETSEVAVRMNLWIPDRALGRDGEFPNTGGDGICAEVPGELVGAPPHDVGIERGIARRIASHGGDRADCGDALSFHSFGAEEARPHDSCGDDPHNQRRDGYAGRCFVTTWGWPRSSRNSRSSTMRRKWSIGPFCGARW